MEVTREQLVERLQSLDEARKQAIANANAAEGAIQFVQSLLAEVDAQAAANKKKK